MTTRRYAKPTPLAKLSKAKFEQEVLINDVYLASWGTTTIRSVESDTRKDPLLDSARKSRLRTETRADQTLRFGGTTLILDREAHPEYHFANFPLFGVDMPYARQMVEPSDHPIWKNVDKKDDPKTRCGVPQHQSGPKGPFDYWPGHYEMNSDETLKALFIVNPNNLVFLQAYENYRKFEGTLVARRTIETQYVNNTTGGKSVQPIESQTIAELEVIERDLGSLPSWDTETRFDTSVIVKEKGENVDQFPLNSGRLKLKDGESEGAMGVRFAFGAVTTGIVAGGLVMAFRGWGRKAR